MKKLINLAGLITGASLLLSTSVAMARDIDIRHVERPVYRQSGPLPYHAAPRHGDRYSRYDRHDHHHRRPLPAGARYDRDRDGVPDRFDRAPRNPYRY